MTPVTFLRQMRKAAVLSIAELSAARFSEQTGDWEI
jgi:hypothetical protein